MKPFNFPSNYSPTELKSSLPNPNPPNINKHNLASTYINTYHDTITSCLSVTLLQLQQIYQKVHLRPLRLTTTLVRAAPTVVDAYTPTHILGDFISFRRSPSLQTPSTISDPIPPPRLPPTDTPKHPHLTQPSPPPPPPLQTPVRNPPANPYSLC